MKYKHNSKQTTAMFKAFSQIVCRIKLTSVTDVGGKNLETFRVSLLLFRETIKKLNGKDLKLILIPLKVSRHVSLSTSNRLHYRFSLQFHVGFKFNQQIRFTKL